MAKSRALAVKRDHPLEVTITNIASELRKVKDLHEEYEKEVRSLKRKLESKEWERERLIMHCLICNKGLGAAYAEKGANWGYVICDKDLNEFLAVKRRMEHEQRENNRGVGG